MYVAVDGCESWEFQCDSGECIEARLKCDGNRDCPDATDEFDCGKSIRSLRGKAQRDSPVRDSSALQALKPLGALWLAGYRPGAISVKVKVGIAWSDLICTMLPKPPTRVKNKNGERSR